MTTNFMARLKLWRLPLIVGLIGSAVALYIDLIAGITTLTLFLFALLISARLSPNSLRGGEVNEAELRFAERVKLALTGNFEAKIFKYDNLIQSQLLALERELSGKELRSLASSGSAPAALHFIMGSNVVANAVLGMSAIERGQIDTSGLALLVLLPFLIFGEVEFRHAKGEVRS
jgi:ABC-type transport system involved in cytochrome bd biosynthesis fused ATPase/permease subunit